jgi:hypothetical protein
MERDASGTLALASGSVVYRSCNSLFSLDIGQDEGFKWIFMRH